MHHKESDTLIFKMVTQELSEKQEGS